MLGPGGPYLPRREDVSPGPGVSLGSPNLKRRLSLTAVVFRALFLPGGT